jgi:hypothetical protein
LLWECLEKRENKAHCYKKNGDNACQRPLTVGDPANGTDKDKKKEANDQSLFQPGWRDFHGRAPAIYCSLTGFIYPDQLHYKYRERWPDMKIPFVDICCGS